MSSMVLSQLLNPDTGPDRKAVGRVPDLTADGSGPGRYDEIVRQQEKRLAQQRVEDRARAKAEQQQRQAESRRADRAGASSEVKAAQQRDPATKPAESRQAEARSDRTGAPSKASDQPRAEDSHRIDPEDPGLAASIDSPEEMAELPVAAGFAGPVPFSLGGNLLTGPMATSGQLPGAPTSAGALFAALLNGDGDSSATAGNLLAGLQGGVAQPGGEPSGKFASLLMTPAANPELALNQPGALRGPEAQALMRGYATSVDTPVGQSEWGEKVMGKLAWLTASQMAVAEIHITPPELGPLDVRVQVQNDQATVTVHATTAAVREQLELHGHRLRDMLSEQGFSLEGFDVTDSSGRQASDQNENGEPGSESGRDQLARQDGSGETAGHESGSLDLSWRGEVDVFV